MRHRSWEGARPWHRANIWTKTITGRKREDVRRVWCYKRTTQVTDGEGKRDCAECRDCFLGRPNKWACWMENIFKKGDMSDLNCWRAICLKDMKSRVMSCIISLLLNSIIKPDWWQDAIHTQPGQGWCLDRFFSFKAHSRWEDTPQPTNICSVCWSGESFWPICARCRRWSQQETRMAFNEAYQEIENWRWRRNNSKY